MEESQKKKLLLIWEDKLQEKGITPEQMVWQKKLPDVEEVHTFSDKKSWKRERWIVRIIVREKGEWNSEKDSKLKKYHVGKAEIYECIW